MHKKTGTKEIVGTRRGEEPGPITTIEEDHPSPGNVKERVGTAKIKIPGTGKKGPLSGIKTGGPRQTRRTDTEHIRD